MIFKSIIYFILKFFLKSFIRSLSLTTKIIIFNIVIFILSSIVLAIKPEWIIYLGIKPSLILQGKTLWTLFTSMFIHASFFHLFVNMFSLYFVGKFVEQIIGKKRFFWFYIIA